MVLSAGYLNGYRNVLLGKLLLQGDGMRRDDDLALLRGEAQCGNEIGQRLPRAGTRLEETDGAGASEHLSNGVCKIYLLLAPAVRGEKLRQGTVFRKYVVVS